MVLQLKISNLLAHHELHAPAQWTKHSGHGTVVQSLLRDGLSDVSTVHPLLGHLVPPDRVTQVLRGSQILHLPDLGLEEVLLDVVVVIDDTHSLHEAGQVAHLVGPELFQLGGADPVSIRRSLLPAVSVHAHEGVLDHGVGVAEGGED